MTAKKTDKSAESEPPEFNWVSLSQPTPDVEDPWKPAAKVPSDPPPYWVTDASGAQYATYVLLEGQKVLDESPFDRSGALRTPIPGGIDTAPAD